MYVCVCVCVHPVLESSVSWVRIPPEWLLFFKSYSGWCLKVFFSCVHVCVCVCMYVCVCVCDRERGEGREVSTGMR